MRYLYCWSLARTYAGNQTDPKVTELMHIVQLGPNRPARMLEAVFRSKILQKNFTALKLDVKLYSFLCLQAFSWMVILHSSVQDIINKCLHAPAAWLHATLAISFACWCACLGRPFP